ncbi:MAG TPA: C4-type zinc ribbon domain-containing protein [Candidatus Acidoferrum sp.]|nr:C4-type zinc ribbon domain-containing protein [Candidatus Acidoferrum sp.]
MKILQDLLELQRLDERLAAVHSRLAAFPKRIAEVDSRLAAARGEVEQTKTAQVANLKDRKKFELDVEQWKDRVRKYKDQTAQIKTNEAYKALQHEVEMAESEIAKAEDRLLEQMVASEEYDRRIKTAEKALKEVEERARVERATIETEKAGVEKEAAELTSERTRVAAEIPEDMLDHYDRIAKKHHGVVLAEIHNELCGACGMRIRPHVMQEIRRSGSTEMFHCETCTRILYFVETESPADLPHSPRPESASRARAGES